MTMSTATSTGIGIGPSLPPLRLAEQLVGFGYRENAGLKEYLWLPEFVGESAAE